MLRRISLLIFIMLCLFVSNLYSMEQKSYPTYEFTIQSASGLQDTDVGRKNKTDAYVIVYVLDKINDRDYALLEIAKTHVVKDNLSPKWNYSFKFTPKNEHEASGLFFFRIVDQDPKMYRNQDIGVCFFKYESYGNRTIMVSNAHPPIVNIRGDFRRIVKKKKGRLNIKAYRSPLLISVPNIVGKPRREAIMLLKEKGFSLFIPSLRDVTNPAEENIVIHQFPAPGEKSYSSKAIFYHVGRRARVSVPNLVGLKYPMASYRLKHLRLGLGVVTYKETTNARKHGEVAAQSAKVHSLLLPGSKIDLTVFKFVQPKPVALPNVIGLSYRAARKKLNSSGFPIRSVIKSVVDGKSNEVVSMRPDPEKVKELPAGSAISLVLAAPELLGTSLAFPIAKKPGEMMSLDFNKAGEYFVKITVDKKGYVKFINPEGTEYLPLDGKMFGADDEERASYSNWYKRRVFQVFPGTYFFKFYWDCMTKKNAENSLVKFKYEIVPEMDFFEPNYKRDQAAFLMAGKANKIALYPAHDTDWFCYQPDEDGYIRVSFKDIPERVNPSLFEIRVYEENSDKNLHAREAGASSVKVFAGKKYFIKIDVTGRGNAPHALNMKIDFFPERDSLEPNDTFGTAYPVTGDFSGKFYFMGVGEREYLKLLPPAWARYVVISAPHTEPLMSPRVYWGATEKEIDDSSFVSPGKCPCTIPIDPKKATYLYFKNEYSTSFSDIPFALNINYFPGKIIDHGNSNMETAKEISFDEKKSFVLAPSGDHDWFSFTVSGPKDIFLKIDNLVDFSMRCYLKNADGDRIDRFHLSSNPEKNKFSIPKAGKYYLKFFFEYSSDSSHQEMDLSLIDDLSKLSAEAESGEEIDGDVETDEEKALDLARKAYAKLKEKQYGKSIELYEKALALDEKRTYWHDMGIAFFQQKQWKEAKRCFKEAVEMDSNYYLGHKSLGAAYGELKDYENSLKEFKLALTLTREDPLLYYNIARTYEAMYLEDQSRVDSLQNALSWSKKAFEKMPDDPKVSRQLLRIKKKMDIK